MNEKGRFALPEYADIVDGTNSYVFNSQKILTSKMPSELTNDTGDITSTDPLHVALSKLYNKSETTQAVAPIPPEELQSGVTEITNTDNKKTLLINTNTMLQTPGMSRGFVVTVKNTNAQI